MTSYDLRRQQQREESEKRIIEAAIKLFGEQGYVKTSVKDIANEAGVANGLVGKYFPTKEILLTKAYLYATMQSYPVSSESLSANESVKRLIQQTLDICQKKRSYYFFFKTMLNSSDLPQEYMDARRKHFKEAPIYSHVMELKIKGRIITEDPHDFFIIYMRMVYNIVEVYANITPSDGNDVIGDAINIVINTINEYLK